MNKKIEHLKDRESYRQAKINGTNMKGYEQLNTVNRLRSEIKAEETWRVIASILLLAFAIGAVIILVTH